MPVIATLSELKRPGVVQTANPMFSLPKARNKRSPLCPIAGRSELHGVAAPMPAAARADSRQGEPQVWIQGKPFGVRARGAASRSDQSSAAGHEV